jgi:predicted nucleic acid-binding protein
MKICVDTTIFLDILKDEFRPLQEIFYSALSAKETLMVPVIVFAELLPQFGGDHDLAVSFLKDHKVQILTLDIEGTSIAGRRWMEYLRLKTKAQCPHCGRSLLQKKHLLSDFYIGGFALAHCDAILTRDRGIYKKYFSDLKGYGGCLDKNVPTPFKET